MVPLSFRFDYTNPEFKNGDVVEIITRPNATSQPRLARLRQNLPRPHPHQLLLQAA